MPHNTVLPFIKTHSLVTDVSDDLIYSNFLFPLLTIGFHFTKTERHSGEMSTDMTEYKWVCKPSPTSLTLRLIIKMGLLFWFAPIKMHWWKRSEVEVVLEQAPVTGCNELALIESQCTLSSAEHSLRNVNYTVLLSQKHDRLNFKNILSMVSTLMLMMKSTWLHKLHVCALVLQNLGYFTQHRFSIRKAQV